MADRAAPHAVRRVTAAPVAVDLRCAECDDVVIVSRIDAVEHTRETGHTVTERAFRRTTWHAETIDAETNAS